MTPNRTYVAAGLGSVAAILAVLGACEPYQAELGGQAFLLPGAHEALTCEQCHGPPPFAAFVWDTNCISCHDLDRKPNDAAHAGYQTCTGTGCHFDTDGAWSDAQLLVDHDFLPFEGPHTDCVDCHGSGTPSADDVIPVGGNSTYCWSCHEEDRLLHPAGAGHYIDDPVEFPVLLPDAELRWDCRACHNQTDQGQLLSAQWIVGVNHGTPPNEIRVPHGTQSQPDINTAPVAITDPTLWVVACVDCHPAAAAFDYADYTCSDTCHQEIFAVPPHTSFQPGVQDGTCTVVNCHPSADMRSTPGAN